MKMKNIIILITTVLCIVSCGRMDSSVVDYKKTVTQHKWKKYEYVDTCTTRYAVVHDWNGRCGIYDLKKKLNLTELEYRELSFSKIVKAEDGDDIAVFEGLKGHNKMMITFRPSGYSTKSCLPDHNMMYSLDSCRTIDNELSDLCRNLLKGDMEGAEGLYGQVLVMDSKTGNIKAWIALEDAIQNGHFANAPLLKKQLCSDPLKAIVAVHSLVENNISWTDSVDTKCGIDSVGDLRVMDYSWTRGGYGKVSYLDGFKIHSNVAMAHAIGETQPISMKHEWDYVANSPREYDALEIANIYNVIANDGEKEIPYSSVNTDSIRILPIMADVSEKDIKTAKMLKEYLKATLQDGGIGSKWTTKEVDLSGDYVVQYNCRPTLYDNNVKDLEKYYSKEGLQTYTQLIFTGYFPSDNPQYTICVTMDKKGKPIYGKLISNTVNRVVEYLSKH